ncbi:hypothetical protein GCM10007973_11350 [Polymorphobacter multimanifer]|uniref:Uncharacterized protein n=1 Tax=Polymorphobacter multimanifer TaxID=1070431 RepID=A0A841L0Z9_9SPHN|nr:hypothetical protein [Polymorphobacter multimanifer]MBB6226090.1 hypothetical protein [Polymorphobacter multimanifer]GGI76257.1 hypothetical protein GCM10007973_11350 [Polymorphobacter multimanifer]
MDDDGGSPGKPTIAALQADVDADLFEQQPIRIIERYLESFSSSGEMTFPVPPHILEALAIRFRVFLDPESAIISLDEAFGGQMARQRQALVSAQKQFEIAFHVITEMQRLQMISTADRGPGTPFEIACEIVAEHWAISVDNVRRIYKEANRKPPRSAG